MIDMIPDYTQYKAEDFAMDPDFIRWFFEKRAEDEAFFQQWLQEHPSGRKAVEEARMILRAVQVREESPDAAFLSRGMTNVLLAAGRSSQWRIPKWSYAAVAVGVIAAGLLLHKPQSPTDMPPKTASMREAANNGIQDSLVRLPDGTRVRLQPGALLRFTFSATRDVYLSGSATFDVVADPDRPFRVFSHELITRVLGTSFTIKADSSDDITVIVHTGKVSVYQKTFSAPNKLTGVVLTPNQELIYARTKDQFQKVLIEKPQPVAPKPSFVYEDAPVTEVLEQLKSTFGIDIIYDRQALDSCRISADLSDESIYKKLDLICKAMGAQYEVVDGVVTIQARRCN